MATVKLHANDDRSDIPLVLLPPFPFDSRVWDDVLSRLGGDVITVDPPGFGGEMGEGEPSLEAYADALAKALEERGVERVVIAGNSMGGYAAMAFAEAYPDMVAGIGLFGTKSTADTDEARQGRLDMAAGAEAGKTANQLVGPMIDRLVAPNASGNVVRDVKQWLAEAPTDGIAWAQRAMAARPDRTEVLRTLDVPAVVVHGPADPMMDAGTHQMMADALGVDVISLPGRGHLLPMEAPDDVAATLLQVWEEAHEAETDAWPRESD